MSFISSSKRISFRSSLSRSIKIYIFALSILLTLLLATTSASHQDASNEQQQPSQQEDGQQNQQIPKYNVPFLLLMSASEIAVAQLPLIENGSISVAYQLFGTDSASSDSKEIESGIVADAREYEQMPLSTSLGKSEWQQIAGNQQSNSGQQSHQEEVEASSSVKDRADGLSDQHNRQSGNGKRPRRSSGSNYNLTGLEEDHTSSTGNNTSINEATASPSVSAASPPEFFSASTSVTATTTTTTNVTSAQFRRSKQQQEEGRASPAEDDKKSGVEFSDFDVHMSLGYAFVADSRGRIHRFRVSGSGRENLNGGNLHENDYTNKIDPASSNDFSSLSATETEKKLSRSNVTENYFSSGVTGDANAGGGYDDDSTSTANKVSSRSDVTHEQSGRHPTASGATHLAAMLNRKFESPVERSLSGSAAPISDAQSFSSTTDNSQRYSSSKPRIIWSRIRNGEADSSKQQQKSHAVDSLRGAFPSQTSTDDDGDQMANNTAKEHAESAYEGDDDQQPVPEQRGAQADSSDSEPTSVGRSRKNRRTGKLRTEVAVDWLNNLLFVLDKYSLLVMDFDGNNELVLIDDFNVNNRPVDIKVDPINDFLFWLQVGNFRNTIYKLDLNVLSMPTVTERMIGNTLKLSQSVSPSNPPSELVALISHHYAHPIITNLPQHSRLFIIDHKHSRIYVPLAPSTGGHEVERNKTQREDAEVFAPSDETNLITHMNSTSYQMNEHEEDKICNTSDSSPQFYGQILAYNLDGTDVGPLRRADEKSHLSTLDDMQDIALDTDKGFLYWLTNDGRELFEEYKTDRDSSFYSAQHSLDDKKYMKLIHFDNRGLNQPITQRPRFNLRKLFYMLSASSATNRWIRSDGHDQVEDNRLPSSLNVKHRLGTESDSLRFSRNAPYIILGITCLAVLSVYLIYALIFQQSSTHSIRGDHSRDGSVGGSSTSGLPVDCDRNTGGFMGGSSISQWIAKPTARSSDTSMFNHESSVNERAGPYDLESTNYNTSNAIDEHYRDVMNNQASFDMDTDRLANLTEWPTNMHDLSNKLYVPVEILQDEALSSIHRVSIDQLEIERHAPLGEGHFGTVLQGTVTCSINEKNYLLNKSQVISNAEVTINIPADCQALASSLVALQQRRIPVSSSTSSGHGSSSTSSEFVTVSTGADQSNGDYLTPKSHCTSAISDYTVENPISSSCSSYCNTSVSQSNQDDLNDKHLALNAQTKLKVAIKKLKDNASIEEKRDFLQEAKLLANFDHPNIVHLIGICLDRGSTLIVMELMLGGDLIRYMQENTPKRTNFENLTNDDLLAICLDIVNGCCYLEELNYIHRDLAARNCLVSSRKREERVVKLADFGLARDIYKDSYYKKLNDTAMPLKWMAPECLIEQKFTTMSDVWSFGVVMWEVMSYCQQKPYVHVEPCLMKVYLTDGFRLGRPENCDEDMYRLMNQCWQLNPKDRPTFQECRAILIEIKNGRRE